MSGRIMYDLATMRLLRIITAVSFVVFAVSVILLYCEFPGTLLLVMFGLYIGTGVFVVCVIRLIGGRFYIARLRRHGYEVPERRKDYGNSLDRLPRSEVPIDYNSINKYSLCLMIVNGIVYISCIIVNVLIITRWINLFEDLIFLIVVLAIADLYWLFSAVIYGFQMNQHKYKDDVETDTRRKNRVSIETGLLTVLVFLVLTLFAKTVSNNLMDYLFKTRIASEKDIICDIQATVTGVYNDYKELPEQDKIDKMLLDGVMITEITLNPSAVDVQSSFWNEVVKRLGASNFMEIRDKFRLTDGTAEIFVQLEEGTIVVQLLNPDKEANISMISDGSKGERPVYH